MDNRCPHRGTRLSIGFVRGERLLCAYHGWGFDGAGACTHIPAHPKTTPAEVIRVGVHRISEAHGLVFLGEAPDLEVEAPLRFCRSIFIRRPREALAEQVERVLGAFPVTPGLWRLGTGLIGAHSPDGHTTAFHVAVAGVAEARLVLARRLAAFRDAVSA